MRKYYSIIGSREYFTSVLKELEPDNEYDNFMNLIRETDDLRRAGQLKRFVPRKKVAVYNDNYIGLVESANDRLDAIIREHTSDDATIYVHNPPLSLFEALRQGSMQRAIVLNEDYREKYLLNRELENYVQGIRRIEEVLIGQEDAIHEIAKSMWYLTQVQRKKPYVIMLYGGSSLGKTELVRHLSKHFFDGKYMEKHLSMFKNFNYQNYLFGEAPNRRSIGYDLLERESNLVFLDELDKCPEAFYSAFYTLFDNTLFKDAVYEVDISGLLIILTSNYSNEEEMKKDLGLPIFYRIDKFIHFKEFTPETIYQITVNELKERECEFSSKFSIEDVYAEVSKEIEIKGENARTIKAKIQKVIEEMLFREVESQYSRVVQSS